MANLGSLTDRFWATASETYASNLSGTILAGATTVPVNSASAYSDGDLCAITVEPGTANQATFIGTKSGSQFVNCVWTEGNTGIGHSAGASVIDYASATHQAALVKGLLIQHNQDGTHKAITAPSITTTGNASFGGTLAVTGASTLTGGLTVGNTTAQFKDQSSNTVDIDPVRRNEMFQGADFIQAGLNPSSASGLVVTIPAGTYYISGKRYTYAGGTKTLGASKDCYLDIDTSGTVTSVEVANGATSGMTLTTNAVRLAKIVTGASSVSSYNVGTTLASAFDPVGNRIRRQDPFEKLIGYAEITASVNMGALGAVADITGLSSVVQVDGKRPIEIELMLPSIANGSNTVIIVSLREGTTQLNQANETQVATTRDDHFKLAYCVTPSAGSHTYKASAQSSPSSTAVSVQAGATFPAFIKISYL